MESSCFPAGFSYLSAFGFVIAIVVLSSWLVQLQRAVYREDGGFRSGLAEATPLWVPALAGVVAVFPIGSSLVSWVDRCLPAAGWAAAGVVLIGLGLALALIAVARLIFGRVRVRNAAESIPNHEVSSPRGVPADAATTTKPQPKLPPERRRVIVEYAFTYTVAVLVTLIGVGLA